MSGGRGNDTYFIDSTGDTITELARGGFDHVYSLVDYALGAELEHVTLLGSAVSATGNSLRNTLVGNAFDNILISGDGDDTLAGNEGRDSLRGGIGSDGYVYENGDGDDVIYENAADAGDDVLVLAGQIRPEDIFFLRDPAAMDDLVIRIADGGSITIKDYYLGNGAGLEGFEFLQGTVWNAAEVALRAGSAIIASGSPPVAADDAYVYAGSNSLRLPVAALLDNDIDPDGDLLTVISVASALEGGAVLEGDEIVVTSSGGPDPRAVFNYIVSDGHGGTATATAEITFWPNSAPGIVSSSFAPVTEDTAAAGSISASDAEGDTLFFSLKSGAGPQKGTVTLQSRRHVPLHAARQRQRRRCLHRRRLRRLRRGRRTDVRLRHCGRQRQPRHCASKPRACDRGPSRPRLDHRNGRRWRRAILHSESRSGPAKGNGRVRCERGLYVHSVRQRDRRRRVHAGGERWQWRNGRDNRQPVDCRSQRRTGRDGLVHRPGGRRHGGVRVDRRNGCRWRRAILLGEGGVGSSEGQHRLRRRRSVHLHAHRQRQWRRELHGRRQ